MLATAMERGETMGAPLWRTTREKMFEVIKKAITNARRNARATSDLTARRNARATSERWMPSLGAEYWYITDTGVVEKNRWEGDHFDTDRWDIGNVFRSKPEAEHAREKLTEVLQICHQEHASPRMAKPLIRPG
jgi:hypothetical protein